MRAVTVAGRSYRDVADEYGVSYVTVLRWVKKEEAKAGAIAPKVKKAKAAPWTGLTKALAEREGASEREVTAALTAELPDNATELEQAVFIQRQMLANARESQRIGNPKAAAASFASAGLLSNTIARMRKNEVEGADVLRIPRHEIQAAADSVRERLQTMRARPLCCSRCSRQLSIDMAYEGRDKPEVIEAFEAESLEAERLELIARLSEVESMLTKRTG